MRVRPVARGRVAPLWVGVVVRVGVRARVGLGVRAGVGVGVGVGVGIGVGVGVEEGQRPGQQLLLEALRDEDTLDEELDRGSLQTWRDVTRCGEMWRDVLRCGEAWGGVGSCRGGCARGGMARCFEVERGRLLVEHGLGLVSGLGRGRGCA